jgi:hypothetical protein
MKTERTKTSPIPTRFDDPESDFLTEAAARTGISRSELVRRSVRLLRSKCKQEGSLGFLLELAS